MRSVHGNIKEAMMGHNNVHSRFNQRSEMRILFLHIGPQLDLYLFDMK